MALTPNIGFASFFEVRWNGQLIHDRVAVEIMETPPNAPVKAINDYSRIAGTIQKIQEFTITLTVNMNILRENEVDFNNGNDNVMVIRFNSPTSTPDGVVNYNSSVFTFTGVFMLDTARSLTVDNVGEVKYSFQAQDLQVL